MVRIAAFTGVLSVCFPVQSPHARWIRMLVFGALAVAAPSVWADAPDSYEPDNNVFQATRLDLSGVPQTHTLSPQGDYDIYRLTLNADATLYVDFEALEADPKPILGFGLFSSSTGLVQNLNDALQAASYIRLTEDTAEFGPVVRTVHLTKGTYYGVVVFVTCNSNPNCNSTPSYCIAVTTLGGPDRYEPDDSHTEARWIDLNGPAQIHQFISPTDQDWVAFYSPGPGKTLTITAIQAGALAVPGLDLYESDGTTVLASTNNSKSGDPSKADAITEIEYVTGPTDTGILYVRVVNTAKDAGTDESFAVTVKSSGSILPSALAGVITKKATGGGCGTSAPIIANATIMIENLGNVSTLSDNSGAYAFASIPADTYTVTASAAGFVSASKTLSVNGTTSLDFALAPSGKGAESLASIVGENAGGDALVMGVAMLIVWILGRRARNEAK